MEQAAVKKLWTEKEKARRADLAEWRKKEKIRAEKAKQDFIDQYRHGVAVEQENENNEVRRIKALMRQDHVMAEVKILKSRNVR